MVVPAGVRGVAPDGYPVVGSAVGGYPHLSAVTASAGVEEVVGVAVDRG